MYTVPGPVHVTRWPSPMFQTIFDVIAMAVTEIPGNVAVAVLGPHVVFDTVAT